MPRKKVIICGAGIGGLTVAHELAKRDFDVVVYERNVVTGGLARSEYVSIDGQTYPAEYSWRVYGSGYKNLLRILGEIPLQQEANKTVFHNLIQIMAYLFPRFDRPGFTIGKKRLKEPFDFRFAVMDYLRIANKLSTCATMCPERMNAMDELRWSDYCKDLSPEARKYLVTFWGPALGMDPTYMSFPVVARFVALLFGGFTGKVSPLYLMNKPTNDGWFDEWVAYLESTGKVHVKTGHEVQGFEITNGEISGVHLLNTQTGDTIVDSADEVVCGLSIETIAKLVQQTPELASRADLSRLSSLANTAKQIQLSVQLYFDQKIDYANDEKLVLYLPDTPWAIIIEPEDLIWDKTYCSDPRVKSVWSVGICQTDVAGIVYGKPFALCTPEEIEDEVMAQIEQSYSLSGIKMEDGSLVDRSHLVRFYIWKSYHYDESTKHNVTWEPKFSNNAGGFKDQPATKTSIPNLTFATAYTRTERFIFSMESAAEAGIRCANHLLNKYTPDQKPVRIAPFQHNPWILRPLLWLDRALFKLGLPHAGTFLGSGVHLIVLYVVVIFVVLVFLLS